MIEKDLKKKDIKKIMLRTDALLTIDEAYLLYNLAKKCKGNIVEIGSYKGGSTVILAKGLKEPYKVYAIDPHNMDKNFESTLEFFNRNIRKEKVSDKIIPIIKTSEKAIKEWNKKIHFLWIDGDHRYFQVKKDFLLWEPFLRIGEIIAFHDTCESKNKSPAKIPIGKNIYSPGQIVKEYIQNSEIFKDVKIVDSITYAIKNKEYGIKDNLKHKLTILVIKPLILTDELLGKLGIIINKISPTIYKQLKKIKWT